MPFTMITLGPYTSLVIRQKLLQLGWDVLPHPPYLSDLAPSNYHLSRSLQNSLKEKEFHSDEAVKQYSQFFVNEDQNFCETGIMKLPNKLQENIEFNADNILSTKVFTLDEKVTFHLHRKKSKNT